MHRPAVTAAEHRLERHSTFGERGEHIRPLVKRRFTLSPVQNRQPLRSDEVRRKYRAQLAIELREDHVEVDCRALFRHHDDDHVADFGPLEQRGCELVDRRGARAFAKADDHEITTKRM